MMAGNPLISTTPPPPTVLMRDGQWLVDPEKRPNGWEKMGVRDPEGAGPKPNALKELSSEPVTEGAIKKQAPNQISGEKKALLKDAFDNGASIRDAAKTAGVAKQTAQKFRESEKLLLSDEQKQALKEAFEAGLSTVEAAEQSGVAKIVAEQYRKHLVDLPLCGCGRPASHFGWCKSRLARRDKSRQRLSEGAGAANSLTIELRSGGILTLTVDLDWLNLDGSDRHFVYGMIDLMKNYETEVAE